jgi:hypothetical protein
MQVQSNDALLAVSKRCECGLAEHKTENGYYELVRCIGSSTLAVIGIPDIERFQLTCAFVQDEKHP